MKIVTYNVNGLRQRISQFGSLRKLLDSFDADIICFQETKLRRQELTAHLVMADGYESFFSCTRTCDKGRTGYSGVATFCRVKSAFSSTEVALPVAAEEGFTGVACNGVKGCKDETLRKVASGLEDFERDVLVEVDGEGRCVVTDHGHFVLFNIYGPRAGFDDMERVQFKRDFFGILRKRLEKLLDEGRRIFVVGDLNIAPTAMDRCDAGPDFENDEFRRWFRSILVNSGGIFSDVFRAKHPDRQEAYTCWPSNTGAEQFNYGSRIDHILCAGSCLHQDCDMLGHSFISCHIKECDILTEYKRWKPGSTPRHRWKGGLGVKLEGSDHAPVYMSLEEIPDIEQHSTPSLSSRYQPVIHGFQQTLVSVLVKRQTAPPVQSFDGSSSFPDENATITGCSGDLKASFDVCEADGRSTDLIGEVCPNPTSTLGSENIKSASAGSPMKKARKSQWSQLSLKSFFQKGSNLDKGVESSSTDVSLSHTDLVDSTSHNGCEAPALDDCINTLTCQMESSSQGRDQDKVNGSSVKSENKVALLEWQRIQQHMQNSLPLCKGHKEPCVSRIVKKPGPTFGHRFYVCARAEGPASNPEANCGYFKWASSKLRHKR